MTFCTKNDIILHRFLAEVGGIEVIVKLLTDTMSEARQFASDCITSMAYDGKASYIIPIC